MLGIISDISIKEGKHKSSNINGGIQLYNYVRKEDAFIPFVFQSSDIEKKKIATGFRQGLFISIQKHYLPTLKII